MIPQKFVNIFMTYWREDASKSFDHVEEEEEI